MCYGIIYMVRNKKNNKVYVGQTTRTFYERYGGSIKNTHNKYLRRSIEKDKIENFVINKCVCACETKEELDKMEQFYIDFFNSTDPKYGYNMRGGGSNGKLSEETKEKVSKNTKKALANPETRKKMSESIKKAYENPEYKKKLSEGVKKALANPEIKKRQSEGVKKALANPEVKKKISEALKGEKNSMYGKNPEDYMTEEAIKIKRKKISESLKGKYCGEKNSMYGKRHSEESKQKISENAKKMWENSEYRKNMSEKLSGKNNPSAKSIIQLDKEESFIRKWDYINEAAKELNINRQSISHCCSGRYKSAGNYKWMYLEDYLDLLRYAF